MSIIHRIYLGDGLYCEYDGFKLKCDRDGEEHYVVLEPDVLDSFMDFVAKMKEEES